MEKAVSNSTPLIYLSKINSIHFLHLIYKKLLIPQEVKKEVVDEGKRLKKFDALLVEKEIENGFIKVCKTKKTIKTAIDIDVGEKAVLALALDKKISNVLIDEHAGRVAADMVGLTPRGTLYVFLKVLEMEKISFNTFTQLLDDSISKGFRLKEEIYIKAINIAKKISDDHS